MLVRKIDLFERGRFENWDLSSFGDLCSRNGIHRENEKVRGIFRGIELLRIFNRIDLSD